MERIIRDGYEDNEILFRYHTKEEGVEALKEAIQLMGGQEGVFYCILPEQGNCMARPGYLGFGIEPGRVALKVLTNPRFRNPLIDGLGITGEEIDSLIAPHLVRGEGAGS